MTEYWRLGGARARKGFNPREPRDFHGRWSLGGPGHTSGISPRPRQGPTHLAELGPKQDELKSQIMNDVDLAIGLLGGWKKPPRGHASWEDAWMSGDEDEDSIKQQAIDAFDALPTRKKVDFLEYGDYAGTEGILPSIKLKTKRKPKSPKRPPITGGYTF